MTKDTIGFIGLGNMGSGMAKNLLAKGFSVLGFDTDSNKLAELRSIGISTSDNVSELSKVCQIVILCLPNPEISRQVIFEQLLAKDSSVLTIIETSTLTPEIVKEFSSKLKSLNRHFLSAPMIGGMNHASNGSILFLVEGSEQTFKDNQSIFDVMGSKPRFMGDFPSATLAKLSFNLSRYANLAVGVETYRLLKKYHANLPAIYDFMSEQSLDNFGQVWKEDLKDTIISNVQFEPSQVPKKDLALLEEMGKSQGIDTKLIEAIRDTYLSME